jgi:hypothetical protein
VPVRCIVATSLFSPESFRAYPAGPVWNGTPKAPDTRFGEAHRFRTVLHAEAKGPPDFAGHYKVVTHGCGAGLACPMFVDLQTGRVQQVSSLASIEVDYARAYEVEKAIGIADTRLVYRSDSRLLVALGTRNENPKLAGATLYEWTDRGPHMRRFIPENKLCRGKDSL